MLCSVLQSAFRLPHCPPVLHPSGFSTLFPHPHQPFFSNGWWVPLSPPLFFLLLFAPATPIHVCAHPLPVAPPSRVHQDGSLSPHLFACHSRVLGGPPSPFHVLPSNSPTHAPHRHPCPNSQTIAASTSSSSAVVCEVYKRRTFPKQRPVAPFLKRALPRNALCSSVLPPCVNLNKRSRVCPSTVLRAHNNRRQTDERARQTSHLMPSISLPNFLGFTPHQSIDKG